MTGISREELSKKAKSINDAVFGRTRKKKVHLNDALKIQVTESAKFALGKALSIDGIAPKAKDSFIDIIKDQPESINVFLVKNEDLGQAIGMLKPLFGDKSKEVLETFRKVFNQLQEEISLDKENFTAS
ncbi:MAG: hypothetical protein CL944_00145 [Candidatus Diapherotrites archaeon]|uniref:Uncharacterized protein n=1 Tax=Candidatus Iainarchaeum sp. TaxID=3101447 RepID=A0A2D6LNV2_9ARCH|nr:hypothetical protein [Candidatus Diapherotrites archaeon]|tara:strand:+ start:8342 stop:8728 length:387 start_codon:yes stop_codon:yes gene_type:complete